MAKLVDSASHTINYIIITNAMYTKTLGGLLLLLCSQHIGYRNGQIISIRKCENMHINVTLVYNLLSNCSLQPFIDVDMARHKYTKHTTNNLRKSEKCMIQTKTCVRYVHIKQYIIMW